MSAGLSSIKRPGWGEIQDIPQTANKISDHAGEDGILACMGTAEGLTISFSKQKTRQPKLSCFCLVGEAGLEPARPQ